MFVGVDWVVDNIRRVNWVEWLGLSFKTPSQLEVVLAALVVHCQSTRPSHALEYVNSVGYVFPIQLMSVSQTLQLQLPVVFIGLQLQQALNGGFASFFVSIFLFFVSFNFLCFQVSGRQKSRSREDPILVSCQVCCALEFGLLAQDYALVLVILVLESIRDQSCGVHNACNLRA